jgi:hypothetical protein
MGNSNRSSVKNRNAEVQAGIDKHVTSTVTIGGVAYAAADLKGVFQAQSASFDQADALHTQWRDQVRVVATATQKANRLHSLLRSYLIGQYGTEANAVLNDFGMDPPKSPGAKTVQVKAAAAEKAQATRKARHTMGKRQKAGIHGTVDGAAPAGSETTAPTPSPATPPSASPATKSAS